MSEKIELKNTKIVVICKFCNQGMIPNHDYYDCESRKEDQTKCVMCEFNCPEKVQCMSCNGNYIHEFNTEMWEIHKFGLSQSK